MQLQDVIEETITNLIKIANTECINEVGSFLPIRKYDAYQPLGTFSSLGEYVTDIAESLEKFLEDESDEINGWEA